jgi:glycosyltransferase involved in cell wall biosynthesis
MKISIITVTFNSAKTVRDTLKSIENQDYNNIEILLIDGMSTDSTVAIASEFNHLNLRIISEQDKGLYDAMNKGISLATGDVVGILNSDDFYTDSSIVSAVMHCFNDTSVDAVYGDLNYVSAENTEKITRRWKSGDYDSKRFLNGWMPPHPTFFLRKKYYHDFGNFDLEFKRSADYELMLRMLYKHQLKAKYIPSVFVHMRTGGASNSSLKARIEANKEDALAWKKNGLQPRWYTTWLKPLSKLFQYF